MTTPEIITLCQMHGEKLDKLSEKLDSIENLLRGTDDTSGLHTRVSILEKFVCAIKQAMWIIIGTSLTALTLISVYWIIFRAKPPM